MSASGKRAATCEILLSQIFCMQILTGENRNTPCYQTTVDMETGNLEEGVWKYKFTSFSEGNMILEEWKKYTSW